MRRVSPLREFLSSLFFFVCVCACTETQRERRGEGETQKTFMERYHTTNAKTPQGLTGTARREEGRGRERERVEERSTPFTALHMWTCVSREQREQGVHTTLLTHSLTHSLPLSPLSPISSARERGREEETKREREEKKRRTLAKTFFCNVFFFTLALPLVSFLPAPLPDTLLDKQEARPTQ